MSNDIKRGIAINNTGRSKCTKKNKKTNINISAWSIAPIVTVTGRPENVYKKPKARSDDIGTRLCPQSGWGINGTFKFNKTARRTAWGTKKEMVRVHSRHGTRRVMTAKNAAIRRQGRERRSGQIYQYMYRGVAGRYMYRRLVAFVQGRDAEAPQWPSVSSSPAHMPVCSWSLQQSSEPARYEMCLVQQPRCAGPSYDWPTLLSVASTLLPQQCERY
ncbi:hypothetical protein J6590_002465 [Homalodisca vitripennis]|nr:hypothetical protein J6590_002465 [Homalodisca vitripennis]